ncbi:hypothetical protein KXX32_009753, partial [Aspergillus fumigatus]
FRRQLMHAHSTRAGYLDLDGCTVVDLLPSSFIPTCAECSTTFPVPGVVAVRGESATASCRQCHRKMVFKIPEVKFLIVGSAAFTSRDRVPQRKKVPRRSDRSSKRTCKSHDLWFLFKRTSLPPRELRYMPCSSRRKSRKRFLGRRKGYQEQGSDEPKGYASYWFMVYFSAH